MVETMEAVLLASGMWEVVWKKSRETIWITRTKQEATTLVAMMGRQPYRTN